jgi:hypothetical protein
LGEGGYVILPDQTNYICTTAKTPWNAINKQTSYQEDKVAMVAYTYEYLAEDVKTLVKLHREKTGFVKKRPTTTTNNKTSVKTKKVNPAIATKPLDEPSVAVSNIYVLSVRKFEKADPTVDYLDENGKLHLDEGTLDSDKINQLFHNQEIQRRLGEFVGITLPKSFTKGSVMRSLLPGHTDKNPSFGVRWSEDKSHLICRDFANYYADKYRNIDYNVVRLYAAIKYRTNVKRLSPNEFVTWFLRMMYEAGIISVDHLLQPIHESIDLSSLDKTTMKYIEGFRLLDALKRTYKGYVGGTVMAYRFTTAWASISSNAIVRVKREAMNSGALRWEADFPGKKGMRATPIFRVGTDPIPNNYITTQSEASMKVNEAIKSNKKSPFGLPATKKEKVPTEEEIRNRYGKDVASVIFAKLGTGMYEKITNFCTDFNIPNVVDSEQMIIPIMAKRGYFPFNLERDGVDLSYYLPSDEFSFDVISTEGNSKMLGLFADNDRFAELRRHFVNIYGIDDLPLIPAEEDVDTYIRIPISFDVSEKKIDQEELNRMSLAFSQYISRVVIEDQFYKVLTDEQLDMVLSGKNPELDPEEY